MGVSNELGATMNRKLAAWIVPMALALAGCASLSWEKNPPLPPGGKVVGTPYTLASVPDSTGEEYVVLFAFSGGGKRSASFGYGALEAAHEIAMPSNSTLADQIDVVSGVSGGSFTASAFALYHDALFDGPLVDPQGVRHPSYKDFLDSNTNAAILAIYLEPWRWQWLANRHIGTNDEMEATYEGALFGETTYKDLAGRGRPYLVVQATDLDAQQPFTFTQTDFDLICSDLSAVKLSRAVAASNGFPVLFSPIGLEMYSYPMSVAGDGPPDPNGSCPDLPWKHPGASYPAFSREALLANRADLYAPPGMSKDEPSFVHLADGGLSDNLALRGMISIWTRLKMQIPDRCFAGMPPGVEAEACATLNGIHLDKVKHILVVSVDGEAEPDRSEGINVPVLGGLSRITGSVLNSVIDSANLSTLPLVADATEGLRRSIWSLKCQQTGIAAEDCKTPPDNFLPDAMFAHVSLSDWAKKNPDKGRDIANSPTGLSLRAGDAAKLIEAGREALKSDPNVNCFLRNAGAAPVGPVANDCPAAVEE